MSCPWCGDVCRCEPQSLANRIRMRPRFEPELTPPEPSQRCFVDPDPYDASEEQFAASLGESARPRTKPKFVVEVERLLPTGAGTESAERAIPTEEHDAGPGSQSSAVDRVGSEEAGVPANAGISPQVDSEDSRRCEPELPEIGLPEHDPSFWKQEVAARVDSFRARRKPRPPKYPSLRLRFEPGESQGESGPSANPPNPDPVVMPTRAPSYEDNPAPWDDQSKRPSSGGAESARIIEFPRSYGSPVLAAYELAEPVIDRPRIVEAPEVAPPPPALGGIIIESEEQESEKRPGFEIPVQTAPMGRRLLASALDGVIVLAASALFGYVFFRVTAIVPPLSQLLSLAVVLPVVFWAGYQYLLLTYTAGTPGLRLAALELRRFDGSPVHRSLRRWRALTSILSALSLGLGFAWCFLDEDALCWHDRITRTYLAPK